MVSYSMSGGDGSSVANVTIDTPSIIFSLDPLFALLEFASAPFKDDVDQQSPDEDEEAVELEQQPAGGNPEVAAGTLAYRVNVVAASVKLLADPSRQDSEAIVLSIRQVQLAQQGTLVLSVDRMGIFLCKMDKQKETVRILDDFDLNLSMDNRKENGNQNTSIELDMQALILRLSSRDISLVSSIASRAVELSGSSTDDKDTKGRGTIDNTKTTRPVQPAPSSQPISRSRRKSSIAAVSQPKAEVIVTKETVCLSR